MTDEELLRRVAEIEGFVNGAEVEWDWNPLKNDAQCLALVKKYALDIYHDSADGRPIWAAWKPVMNSRTAEDESLNRAICLAIVEAHEANP